MRSTTAVLLTAAFSFTLFTHKAWGADCERDTFRLGNQGDADALSDCPTLTGDVVIAATAEGSIDLKDIEQIQGTLSNEDCFDIEYSDNTRLLDGDFGAWEDCRGLESLSSGTLSRITGDFTLQSLVDITEVDFKNLEAVNGTLTAEYLPHLERMNFSSLELTESVFIRHNHQLTNLTLSALNNITAEESTIELVDLGIYEWPRINIRIQHFSEESPRRLERLLAKDLPNIPLFEFNNALEFGLLEVHGFFNQTAQLTTHYTPMGRQHRQPFTEPVAVIDNLTMVGFGGEFGIELRHDDPKNTTDIKHVRMVNTNMSDIRLDSVGKPRSFHIADNSELIKFSMPPDMDTADWEAIEFKNNPKLSFGERWFNAPTVHGWSSNFNASIFSIENSPVTVEFINSPSNDSLVTYVTERFVIEPSGNVTEVCDTLLERTKEANLVFPDGGYTCGGEHYSPKVSAAARGPVSCLSILVAVGCCVSWVGVTGVL